jgi:hypothetical protein
MQIHSILLSQNKLLIQRHIPHNFLKIPPKTHVVALFFVSTCPLVVLISSYNYFHVILLCSYDNLFVMLTQYVQLRWTYQPTTF